MFCSKILMEFLPNIHLLGMFTMVYTLAFRKKALIPIYVSVLLTGLYFGFNMWWLPYIYIWTILWAVTMALPQYVEKGKVYCISIVCLHALAHSALLGAGDGTRSRHARLIVSGLPWDWYGAGNLVAVADVHWQSY